MTQRLIEMNTTLARKEYDPARDNAEVVSVMYEVDALFNYLMYFFILNTVSLVLMIECYSYQLKHILIT